MQCPSCEFQNMPGSGRCARCGSSLALATAAIDVHPPRAGRVARRMPRFWGIKQAWGNFSMVAGRPFENYFAAFDDTNFDLSTVVRLIVPGWATWYRGRPARGLTFFAAFVGLLLSGIVLFGTGLGSVLLGLAFGVHVASAVDAMIGKFAEFNSRLMFTLACGLALLFLVYLPIGFFVGRVATPIQITQAIGVFQRGDVLWYDRSADVAADDLVYYNVPETRVAGRLASGQAANFVFQNQWINRVLAVGGQTVAWDGSRLQVDGSPIVWQGRTDFGIAPGESFVVPAGYVLIPPETLVVRDVHFDVATWRRLALVPRGSVIGQIYFRSLPLWRFSSID